MRMDIYGFKARITNDGKQYIGSISELHVHDQANSLRELESELKDAVDTAVSFMLEKRGKTAVRSPQVRSLIMKA